MLSYQKLMKKPSHLHRLTGLTVMEFEQLLDKFQSSWNMYMLNLSKDLKRKRKIGGGRHATLLSLEDKLLFILVYVRMYPLLFLQGAFLISENKMPVYGFIDSYPF